MKTQRRQLHPEFLNLLSELTQYILIHMTQNLPLLFPCGIDKRSVCIIKLRSARKWSINIRWGFRNQNQDFILYLFHILYLENKLNLWSKLLCYWILFNISWFSSFFKYIMIERKYLQTTYIYIYFFTNHYIKQFRFLSYFKLYNNWMKPHIRLLLLYLY